MKRLLISIFIFIQALFTFAYDIHIDSVTTAPANCGNDGSITVYLGGIDIALLEQVIYSTDNKSSSMNTIPGLFPGTYNVTVSGFIGGTSVILDTTAVVGGTTSYVSLNTRLLSTRDAMPSMATGKVTFSITQGKLPYTVEVREGNVLVATETFTEVQSEYVLENLSAGSYEVNVSDGCSNSYYAVEVVTLNPPFDCGEIFMYPTQPSGTICISMFSSLSLNEYYSEHQAGTKVWWEYSYSFDGGAFTSWADIPQDGKIYDNISTTYCDVWEKEYTVRVRVKNENEPNGQAVCTQKLIIAKPYASFQQKKSLYDTGCIKDTFIVFSASGTYYHPPLSMTVTNITENAILYNGVYTDDILIQITGGMIGDTLRAVFEDEKACIFDREVILIPRSFDYWYSSNTSSPCSENFVGVNFKHYNVIKASEPFSEYPPAGTVVELIEAPDPQLCFKASYNRDAKTWNVNSVGRLNVVTEQGRVGLVDTVADITDATLPSGQYAFRIYDDCGIDTIFRENTAFYRYRVIQPLKISKSQLTCEGVEFFPVNKVERYLRTTSGYAQGEDVDTYFSVSSPDGGRYSTSGDNWVNSNSVIISPQLNEFEHKFVVADHYIGGCPVNNTVTFDYNKPPSISFSKDGIVAYRCPSGNTTIIAVADSTTGVKPYQFILNTGWGTDNKIMSNDTGVFRFNTTENKFSVKLTDGCNKSDAAYSETKQDISLLNIGVDGLIIGKKYICLGEKSSIICRLNAGVCEWTRPDGRVETGRKIQVSCEDEDNLEIGWYHLKITGLDCDAYDSIYVDVEYPFCDTIYLAPVCDSELPYQYDGVVFHSDGFHSKHCISRNGCDSTIAYHLTVHPTYMENRIEVICESDLPYVYADTTFHVGTQTGLYTFYRKTINGCDSVVDLELIVGELKETIFHDTIFKYEDYRKHNFDLPSQTVVGDFTHVQNLTTILGCDSTVTLYLTVHPIVKVRINQYDWELCGDEKDFVIQYEIYEGHPDSCFVQFSQNAIRAGFYDFTDDNPNRSFVPVPLPDKVRSDYYSLNLVFKNTYGYIDRHAIDFTVLYPASVMMQMWNDVLALKNSANNGGYEFTSYRWYKNGYPLAGENQSYIYAGPDNILDMAAEYQVELTRLDDGVILFTCPLIPEMRQETSVYPTLVSKSQNITVKAVTKGNVVVWSTAGVKLSEQRLDEGDNKLSSPTQPGTYLLDINFDNGVKNKQLIIVR
ncbi:T9SS C-terminal target domain-containing protein [Paludibacter sp. 221]|uniref:T9SS type A sorting domain-containing protein n=1 Tax=Paludibacter sp. 221 TaxID=2302939 RepID=UPI0013D5E6F5|nr:T9SS type A sorting domain-containing protein [Paludibacter sp. 221]NDV46356.1 T9SS C-terminal target domain-containing protein [Paludibacter sp. 221]